MSSPDSIPPFEAPPPELHPWPAVPPENPAWNLLDVLLIAVFAFCSLIIILGLGMGLAHSLPRFHRLSPAELGQNAFILVPAQTVAYLLVIAFMVQRVHTKGHDNFLAAVSWNQPHGQRIRIALAGGAGLAALSAVFTVFFSRWIPKSLPIDKLFHDPGSAYLLALFGMIVAPFVEELFFRGFLYPALARHIGVGPSVALTAAAFAVVHQQQLAHAWAPLAWLFIVGVVLTVVRARTKSVATCILIHVAYNTTLFAFFFAATKGFHHFEGVGKLVTW